MGIKTVQDSSLTAIADAIRAKTGKSASMQFPADFVSEIGSIETGGGGSDMLPTFIANQNVGSYTFNDTSVTDWQFAEKKFTYLSIPNVVALQKDNVFYKATIDTLELNNLQVCRANFFANLIVQTLSVPKLATIGSSAFQKCSLSSLNLPNFVNCTGQTAFKEMDHLVTAVLPKCTTPGNYSFESCGNLTAVDFTALATVPQGLFNRCTALNVIILRNTTAVALANVNAFLNMAGKAVTVYVPSALVAAYPNMTNWASVTGATLTFAAIEGSPYETQYADGTLIPSS